LSFDSAAQSWHLATGWPKEDTQASQMAYEGQALQMAHWLGKYIANQYTSHTTSTAFQIAFNRMPHERPPSLDPIAARRWATLALGSKPFKPSSITSPWLHEEVARRMEERLTFIRMQPRSWVCWNPLRAGLNVLTLLRKRYPQAIGHLYADRVAEVDWVQSSNRAPWWKPASWFQAQLKTLPLKSHSIDMVWANMLLHQAADPETLLAEWHRVLAVDGFLMFSCLGPDTLQELRAVYAQKGWPMPSHEFTDMHDWGDMLVHAGFAEPVMDMEKISLTYVNSEKLVEDLRKLGRNFHVSRFAGLRGKNWYQDFQKAILSLAQNDAEGRLVLTFEVVYGHALKPQPRIKVDSQSRIGLDDMRQMLRNPQKKSNQV
jgi:malonyl-CoA O-methyltransferase